MASNLFQLMKVCSYSLNFKLEILNPKLSINFKTHVQTPCKMASQKLHALSRISIFMEPKKYD